MHETMVMNFGGLSSFIMCAKAHTPLLRFVVDLLYNSVRAAFI